MPQDIFSERRNRSWGSRLGNSIRGVLIGILLIVGSTALLYWNEGRAVRRYNALVEGAGAVLTVSANEVAASNEGKLIHLAAPATVSGPATDPIFGISETAIKLRRNVLMYQWKESKHTKTVKKLGGGEEEETTYSYGTEWEDRAIDSSNFRKPEGHRNPPQMAYAKEEFFAERVNVGAFTLSSGLIRQLTHFQDLSLEGRDLSKLASAQGTTRGNEIYIGKSPETPQVGDLRVSFSIVPPQKLSIVAKQERSSFATYQTTGGGTIELIETGEFTAAQMFEKAQRANTVLTWGLRVGGYILGFIGFAVVLAPLSIVADVVPLIGNIVGAGTRVAAGALSLVTALLTIAVSWLTHRPILAIALIGGAIAAIVFSQRKGCRAIQQRKS